MSMREHVDNVCDCRKVVADFDARKPYVKFVCPIAQELYDALHTKVENGQPFPLDAQERWDKFYAHIRYGK